MPEQESSRMPSVLNRKGTKTFALMCSQSLRNGRFTRVEKDFFESLEIKVRQIIRDHVASHPTVGKTIQRLYLGEMPAATGKAKRRKS